MSNDFALTSEGDVQVYFENLQPSSSDVSMCVVAEFSDNLSYKVHEERVEEF